MAASDPLNLYDFEALARSRMDPGAFDYFAGGAADELTLGENCRAFQRIVLRPRVMVNVSVVDVSTRLLGRSLSFPVMLAPTALNRLGHPDGEVAAARAAGAAGTAMVLSTTASSTIEEVAAGSGDLWFQLYVYRDRAVTHDLVRRAEAGGCRALVLTVDRARRGRGAHRKAVSVGPRRRGRSGGSTRAGSSARRTRARDGLERLSASCRYRCLARRT